MPSFHRRASALASGTFFLTLVTSQAFALDATTIGNDVKAAMASQGIGLTFDGATLNGDDVTLNNAKGTMQDLKGSWDLGDLTLENVSERDGGGHLVERIVLPEIAQQSNGVKVEATSTIFENVTLPPSTKTGNFYKDTFYYEKITVDRVAVNSADKDVFVANDIKFVSSPLEEGKDVTGEGGISSFNVDLPPAGSDKTLQTIAVLGYSSFEGDMWFKSSWNPANGETALSQGKIAVKDAASLDITGNFGGMTLEVMQALQELSANAEKSEQSPEAMQLAMLGLLQQMTVGGLSIRLDDASLTNKVLDHVAKQQGTSREGLIGQAQFLLPAFLGYFQNPAFTQDVSGEAIKFLQNPGSLTIAAKPDQPLPVAQLMTLSQAPQTIPTVLNLTVTAND